MMVETIIFDIDGSLTPGPDNANEVLRKAQEKFTLVPCTMRSVEEARRDSLIGDAVDTCETGVFENGAVIRRGGRDRRQIRPETEAQLIETRGIIKEAIDWVGVRKPDDLYGIDPADRKVWGYLKEEYRPDKSRRPIPIAIPDGYEASVSIWPSGSGRVCPPDMDFYEIVPFLNSIIPANLGIVIGEESIMVMPVTDKGEEVSKRTGLERLAKKIELSQAVYIGDDDRTDFDAALFVKDNGGQVYVPENSGPKIKSIAAQVLQGTAGYSVIPFIEKITEEKQRELKVDEEIKFEPFIKPKGVLADCLTESGFISSQPQSEQLIRGRDRFLSFTNKFSFATAIEIPREIKGVEPMLYINEGSFGMPDELFSGIPELVIFNDKDLLDWMAGAIRTQGISLEKDALWLFPGGGGDYVRRELRKRGINPARPVSFPAKRIWSDGEVYCKLDLPDNALRSAYETIVFCDDVISTGTTLQRIASQISFRSNRWKRQEVPWSIITEAIGIPRKKDLIENAASVFMGSADIYSALFYTGTAKRPRLLTTGSVIRGMKESQYFSVNSYPPDLIRSIKRQISL